MDLSNLGAGLLEGLDIYHDVRNKRLDRKRADEVHNLNMAVNQANLIQKALGEEEAYSSPEFLATLGKAGVNIPTQPEQMVTPFANGAGPISPEFADYQTRQRGIAPGTGAVIPAHVQAAAAERQIGLQNKQLQQRMMAGLFGGAPGQGGQGPGMAPNMPADFQQRIALDLMGVDPNKVLGTPQQPTPPGTQAYSAERAGRAVQAVDKLMTGVDGWSTGLMGNLARLPWPTAAGKLQLDIKTLETAVIASELSEMREASKTGGALGQVSDYENRLLASAFGALDPIKLGPEAFKAQLQNIKDSIIRWHEAKRMIGSGQPYEHPAITAAKGQQQTHVMPDGSTMAGPPMGAQAGAATTPGAQAPPAPPANQNAVMGKAAMLLKQRGIPATPENIRKFLAGNPNLR